MENFSIVLPETSPALPPEAKHNELLTFSLRLTALQTQQQQTPYLACHWEKKFDTELDKR